MNHDENNSPSGRHPGSPEREANAKTAAYAPRKMSSMDNLVLTIKVLSGFGLLGAALWGISVLTAR